MKVCIPTLICYNECYTLIESILKGSILPKEIHIFDNGGGFNEFLKTKQYINFPINIVSFYKNLGVSASWNYCLKNIKEDLLFINDDIEFYENTLEFFIENKKSIIE